MDRWHYGILGAAGLAISAEGRFIPCQKVVSGVLPEIGFWPFWHLIRQKLNDLKHKT